MRPAGNRQASGGVSSRCPASTIFAGALPQIKCYLTWVVQGLLADPSTKWEVSGKRR